MSAAHETARDRLLRVCAQVDGSHGPHAPAKFREAIEALPDLALTKKLAPELRRVIEDAITADQGPASRGRSP